ncbi:MAG TPA: DNA recombination protein RmuC [Chromatiales bacterium]|nr:DNA recombination protein RmuC [Chromatiales bacterium]HEX22833.1 DNA recombination protein RmuC [Chromatiales bacterium]
MPDYNFTLSLDTPYLIGLALAVVLGVLFGWLIGRLRGQRRIAELSTTLDLERRTAEDHLEKMQRSFAGLSTDALHKNNQLFLQLAQESLKRFHVQASDELEKREQAVGSLVAPIREALERAERNLRDSEKERREAYGALGQHIETLTRTQQQLHNETRNLVQALRRPEVRGRWGEMTLRRLAELAGMVDHCDFYEQEHKQGEDGALRPDMVVRMPAGREVVIDVKTPLDAYLSAMEATDAGPREQFLASHARNVRKRVQELASKAYWGQFPNAPDFVVLFIPGEQFLNAALDVDRDLLEYALARKVILATPASLVALLRAIAFGWRHESLAANAEKIRVVGESLYNRLATFAAHLGRLGRSLDSSVSQFNQAVGSFDATVMPGARRFTELGLTPAKKLDPPAQIEKGVREVAPAGAQKKKPQKS